MSCLGVSNLARHSVSDCSCRLCSVQCAGVGGGCVYADSEEDFCPVSRVPTALPNSGDNSSPEIDPIFPINPI